MKVISTDDELWVVVKGCKTEYAVPWASFERGEFSPAVLAKQIVAEDLGWSPRTLERRLREARRHHMERRRLR